jgi:hypothetical protein
VPWRYAVLSNMLLTFAAPPANSGPGLALVRHCLALMRSDMLLLRQLGAAGLWLLLAPTMPPATRGSSAARGSTSAAVLQELRQVRMHGCVS